VLVRLSITVFCTGFSCLLT